MSPTASMAAADPVSARTGFPRILPQRNWGWFLARGLLLIALGVVALLRPGPALIAFSAVFAAYCLIDGVLALVSGVRGARDRSERWGSLLLSGVAGIVIAALFVLFPLMATLAFALTSMILVAAWGVVSGVCQIATAVRLRKAIRNEWLLGLSGVLSVLLGLSIAAMLILFPAISAVSVAFVIGIYALAAGAMTTVLAFRLRKHGPASGKEPVELGAQVQSA